MLDPVLERVMKDDKDADYLKIDTDNEAELAAKYKVNRSIHLPALRFQLPAR
jgi:hypothetical protein